MEEFLGIIKNLVQEKINKNTNEFLEKHDIRVSVNGEIPQNGLIIATHPTILDSIFWRAAIPRSYHAVNSQALRKTGIREIDDLIAIYGSFMIPVYSGNSSDRQRTYKQIKKILERKGVIVFNPTGKSANSNLLPDINQIKVGGLIRIQQEVANLSLAYPAYVFVHGDILVDGTIKNRSHVQIEVGEPFALSKEEHELRSNIYNSWQNLHNKIISPK